MDKNDEPLGENKTEKTKMNSCLLDGNKIKKIQLNITKSSHYVQSSAFRILHVCCRNKDRDSSLFFHNNIVSENKLPSD